VHCSRVFRSSAPSDLLPSSPRGRPSGTARVNAAALDQWNGGSAPVAECRTEGAVRQGNRPARHIPEGTFAGAGRSQGRAARCVIQNWPHVLSASRRAWICMGTMARAAWTRGRAGQPVVSYVGYSLKDPWSEPRVVIGIDADEPSTWPNSSTAMNAHNADSRSCRRRSCRSTLSCRRPRSSRCRSSRSRSSRVGCSQVRFSRSS